MGDKMKSYTKNLFGKNHRYSAPEDTRIPKSSSDRKGTRSSVRQGDKQLIKEVKEDE